ncbi:MAG: hypothetical protein FK733_10070 [Asgard group archaeon]|nr:hypothetical protein [Asgard group archaeon]
MLLILGLFIINNLFITEFQDSKAQIVDTIEETNLGILQIDDSQIIDSIIMSEENSYVIWDNLTIIDEPYRPASPTVVTDSNNYVHILWSTIENGRSLFHKILYPNGTWGDREVVFNSGFGEPIYCHATTDDIGQVHVAYSWGAGPGSQHTYYIIWTDGIWSDFEQVDVGHNPFGGTIPSHNPQIVVDKNGIPHVIYSGVDVDSVDESFQPLFYQKRVGVGLWTSLVFVGYSPPGNYRMVIDDDNIIHLVYSRRIGTSYNTRQEIYYADKHIDSSSFGLSDLLLTDFNSEQLYDVPRPEIIISNGTIHVFVQLINEYAPGIYSAKLSNGNWTDITYLTDKTAIYGDIRLAGTASDRGEIILTWPRNPYDLGPWIGGIHHLEILGENMTATEAELVTQNYTLAFDPSIDYDSTDKIHLVWWDNIDSNLRRVYYIQGRFDNDRDGLSNTDEINIHLTDPLDADSDDDGFEDGEEYNFWIGRSYNVSTASSYCLNNDVDSDTIYDGWEYDNAGLDPDNATDATLDMDLDGIDNAQEWAQFFIYGEATDPNNNDTDGDTLLDGAEVLTHLTNPLEEDSDFDELRDDEELVLGADGYITNPLLNDTENDGLPDGYEYTYGFDPTFNDSYNDPDADMLLSIEEFGYGTNPINNDTDTDLLDDYEEIFTYFTNPLLPDSDFDALNDYYEVMIDPLDDTYQTNNTYQTNPLYSDTDFDGLTDYIELDISLTNPIVNDTDGDLMLDGYEYIYGLDPFVNDAFQDKDGDGLTNLIESTLLSNPDNIDTDGDRLLDNIEYQIGTSLILYDTDGDGLSDYNEYIHYHTDPTSADPDEDGLNDLYEYIVFGTDPFNNDTDGDTLLDGDEVFNHSSNPNSRDSDGDGLHDQIEVAFTSDPNIVDTDGDNMDDLFEYTYGFNPRFNDGNLDADSDGVRNIDEYWLGGNPLQNDTDGDLLSDYDEAYVYFSALNLVDTDYDMLSDYEEVYNGTDGYITSPTDPDTDDDKLLDGNEVLIYSTNPLLSDSDGDGYTDFEEINANTDPLNSSSNPSRRTIVRIFSVFSGVVGILIIYYVVPSLFAKFKPTVETEWIKEGIEKRRQKTDNLMNNNKNESAKLDENKAND